jgi:hypothetical protein
MSETFNGLTALQIDDTIGLLVMYGNEDEFGSFVWNAMMLWQRADPVNKRIYAPVLAEWIVKYNLVEIAKRLKASSPSAKTASDEYLAKGIGPF